MLNAATVVISPPIAVEDDALPPFLVRGDQVMRVFSHRGERKIWYSPGTGHAARMLLRCRFGRAWPVQALRLALQGVRASQRVQLREPVRRWLAEIGLARADLVIQRGSHGLYRKYVALGVGGDGQLGWVLKCADAAPSRGSMAIEARALAALTALADPRVRIPRLYGATEVDGLFLTAQEACIAPDAPVVRTWGTAHHEFLLGLGGHAQMAPGLLIGQGVEPRERIRVQLVASWPGAAGIARTAGDLLAHACGAVDPDRIPVGWTHRDFTPWNAFPDGRRLTVLDWEWADPTWTPLHDCFHFLWFPGLLSGQLVSDDWRRVVAEDGAAARLARALNLPGRVSAYAAWWCYDVLLFYADAVRREGRDPTRDALVERLRAWSVRLLEWWRVEEEASCSRW